MLGKSVCCVRLCVCLWLELSLCGLQQNYDNMERELRRHEDLDAQHEDERAQLKRSRQESDNEIAVLRGYCRLFINNNNNNTNICNAHSVSKHTESEAQAVAR